MLVQRNITRETKRYFELNDDENTTKPKLWDDTKAMLGGKCYNFKSCIRKKKVFKSNELYLNYKKLETIKQQNESKADRKKKIVKIKTEHEIANRKAIEKNQWNWKSALIFFMNNVVQ